MCDSGKISQVAVEKLYDSRRNFVVVGLTGLSGCGCSTLASYMEDEEFFRNRKVIRDPKGLHVSKVNFTNNTDLYHNSEETLNQKALSEEVFKRKYSICYNYLDAGNYHPYKIIKYTRVIWLYVLLYTKKVVNMQNRPVNRDDIAWKITDILKSLDQVRGILKRSNIRMKNIRKLEEAMMIIISYQKYLN